MIYKSKISKIKQKANIWIWNKGNTSFKESDKTLKNKESKKGEQLKEQRFP